MADTASPHTGVALSGPAMDDPFISTPEHVQPSRSQPPPFDPDAFVLPDTNSPNQVLRVIETRLKETDRQIQETSRVGTTLVQQRKNLYARKKELEDNKDNNNEIGPDLKKKLADLEREYTDVGRETARAVLPKTRLASSDYDDQTRSPAVFAAQSNASPSKVAVPSRKQRNQPTTRVHDIEFATEISTSLLAQVRSLQAALVEKDDALKQESATKAQLEAEYGSLRSKLRHVDENEQRYKDENWNLETQVQDLTAAMKAAAEKEQRVNQTLKQSQSQHETVLRELEDLKQAHGKLNEDVAASKRSQESELHNLRRDINDHENEREQLQRKIEELTSQNTELARAISYRMNGEGSGLDKNLAAGEEDMDADRDYSEHSPPPSPTKRAPGQVVLETETLRSSIQHAHRMIQTLKNNIHREKTEKLELKRMLQDARDELENKRGDNKNGSMKSRRSVVNPRASKTRSEYLGANRLGREEIINDPDWEDQDGDATVERSGTIRGRNHIPGEFTSATEDSTDAFETANEKDTSTESEAFQTTNEGFDGDSSGEATETEGAAGNRGPRRFTSIPSSMANAKRLSFMSTASTSADEDDDIRTPLTGQPRQNRVKSIRARGSLRDVSASSNNTPSSGAAYRDSPVYSQYSSNHSTPAGAGQTLGDELDGLSDEASVEGTPSKSFSLLTAEHPIDVNRRSVIPSPLATSRTVLKPPMVDSGMMTEPWELSATSAALPVDNSEPEKQENKGVLAATAGAIGGLVTGTFLGRSTVEPRQQHIADVSQSEPTALAANHDFSHIISTHTEPRAPAEVSRDTHQYAPIQSLHTAPVPAPLVEASQPSMPLSMSSVGSQSIQPTANVAPAPATAPKPADSYHVNTVAPGIIELPAGDENALSDEKARQISASKTSRAPLGEIDNNAAQSSEGLTKVYTEAGAQTLVTAEELETLMKNRQAADKANKTPVAAAAAGAAGAAAGAAGAFAYSNYQGSPRKTLEPFAPQTTPGTAVRRPGSSGSIRNKPLMPAPPLPVDHSERIAMAGGQQGSMGPPLMPASAYRASQREPSIRSRTSTVNTAHRAGSGRPHGGSVRGPLSRRSSISSFTSEVDHRLNPGGGFAYPADIPPSTDPRMITAITQTMIGEYLWKYTRSPLSSSSISSNRHRRFFWVHPYTRTLYWSDQDPSTAGKAQLKAKSVAIEAVRVMTDDNAYPPGLFAKSLVVVTPSRELVFTAPTSQRHETWFNALSYLLLRTVPTSDANTQAAMMHGGGTLTGASASAVPSSATASNAEDLDDDELSEFNPSYYSGVAGLRSANRAGRMSHASMHSYASNSSRSVRPHHMDVPTLTPTPNSYFPVQSATGNSGTASPARGPGSSVAGSVSQRSFAPSPAPPDTPTSLRTARSPSVKGRIGSFFGRRESVDSPGTPSTARRRSRSVTGSLRNYVRPGPPAATTAATTEQQGANKATSVSSRLGSRDGAAAAAPSGSGGMVEGLSGEELRRRIEEDERRSRMENVRACCDGKHDVGSLAHRRGESARGRAAEHHVLHHQHSHSNLSQQGSVHSGNKF